MTTPTNYIETILFGTSIETNQLLQFIDPLDFMNSGDFHEINWLNTPGPIYTTTTDNCGTGQVEAINNVGGDEDYCEIIFKQPFTRQELKETLLAAAIDPFGSYYFDGNVNWNKENIILWWNKSEDRIFYILERYREELNLPKILDRPLYGPRSPIPENYKYWLDFYQFGMRDYLEWYIYKMSKSSVELPELKFNWTKRDELDELFNSRK